jgi:PAS domain S-box-containing protein
MIDMRVEKSTDKPDYSFSKIDEENISNSGTIYCQAIENADGVPFQLIFGSQIGEGYYLNIGEGIKQLTGIKSEELTEKQFYELIEEIIPLSEEIPSNLTESREKFINGGLKRYKAEVLIRRPDGERVWILDSSLPLTDEDTGKVIGAFGILFDINDRKLFRGSLNEARAKAEESDRLKTAFLHNISHEIRTPLNAILGFSALLGETGTDPDKKKEFMEIISRSSEHLLETINHIIEISRIEAGTVKVNRKRINLNALLREVYEKFRNRAFEKKITLCLTEALDDNEVNIITDGIKLGQIISNLLSNSIKFTQVGRVDLSYILKNDKIEFHFSDTGIGIPSEHYNSIFSRFYQVESGSTRHYEGTGLGLSISKAYVELLGGEIWLTSKPGKGSVFYFTVPLDRM